MVDKKIVVIIDDDEDLSFLLESAFKAQGFACQILRSGSEALAFFKQPHAENSISLIILDRVLPDMDGISLLNGEFHTYLSHVPVLILSVLASEKDIMEGLKKGVVDYITKPFSLPILMKKALALIEKTASKKA